MDVFYFTDALNVVSFDTRTQGIMCLNEIASLCDVKRCLEAEGLRYNRSFYPGRRAQLCCLFHEHVVGGA
jgi:hypothetical protein